MCSCESPIKITPEQEFSGSVHSYVTVVEYSMSSIRKAQNLVGGRRSDTSHSNSLRRACSLAEATISGSVVGTHVRNDPGVGACRRKFSVNKNLNPENSRPKEQVLLLREEVLNEQFFGCSC